MFLDEMVEYISCANAALHQLFNTIARTPPAWAGFISVQFTGRSSFPTTISFLEKRRLFCTVG
jgi:hypothetical protein